MGTSLPQSVGLAQRYAVPSYAHGWAEPGQCSAAPCCLCGSWPCSQPGEKGSEAAALLYALLAPSESDGAAPVPPVRDLERSAVTPTALFV